MTKYILQEVQAGRLLPRVLVHQGRPKKHKHTVTRMLYKSKV